MVSLIHELGHEKFRKEFSGSPKILSFLEANFKGANPEAWNELITNADESHFSLRDWVQSLIILGHWLDARNLKLPLSDQIGYVCCAAESAGAGSNLEYLPSLVEVMLEQYGCERAEKVSK